MSNESIKTGTFFETELMRVWRREHAAMGVCIERGSKKEQPTLEEAVDLADAYNNATDFLETMESTKLPEPRPVVKAFAREMEKKLRANDHKSGWQTCAARDLLRRLREELAELETAVNGIYEAEVGADTLSYTTAVREARERVIREAADVANFAMMIADNCCPDGAR